MIPQNDSLLLVLQHRYAGKAWCYNGDGYEGLHWTDEQPKPTEKQLRDQFDTVMTELREISEQRENAAQSARSKLKALGLTDDEIAALAG